MQCGAATSLYIHSRQYYQADNEINAGDQHGETMIASRDPAYHAVCQWTEYRR
jgi:hypothetical protein